MTCRGRWYKKGQGKVLIKVTEGTDAPVWQTKLPVGVIPDEAKLSEINEKSPGLLDYINKQYAQTHDNPRAVLEVTPGTIEITVSKIIRSSFRVG